MRKAILALLLLAVPLAMVPWAVTFDACKATLLAVGALVLVLKALPKRGGDAPGRLDVRWSPVTVAMAAAFLALAASAFRGPDPWAASRFVALLLAAGAVAFAVENALFDAGDLRPMLLAVGWSSGIVSAYGLLQAAGIDFPFSWREGGRTVPVSTLGNPNFAAEYVAAALPVTVLLAIRGGGGGRAGAALGVLLGVAFLAVARGRAALLLGLPCAAAAAAALRLAAGTGARRAAGFAVAGSAMLCIVGGYSWLLSRDGALPAALGRSDTVVVRVELARGTARMLGDHPLGVGAGNWEAAYPPYRTEREYRASLFRDPGEAHCDPLQFAAEGGWPAAAAILVLGFLIAAAALRAVRTPENRGDAVALAATLAATVGASVASAPFHRPASLLLAAFATGGLAFLGGGRVTTLGGLGRTAHYGLALLLAVGTFLLGQRMAAEAPQAEGRAIFRESDPLPVERAVAAAELFDRAASLDPGAVDAFSRAGEAWLKVGAAAADREEARGRYEWARERFGRIGPLRPADPTAGSNFASALAAGDGSPMKAEETWRLTLGIAPWHRNANQGLGWFLVHRKRPAEALPFLERALDVDPLYAAALGTWAHAMTDLGREGEATERLSDGIDRLLKAPPRDFGGAAEASRRAAAASPLFSEMLLGKASRLLGGPDKEGGRAVLRGVCAARPEEEVLDRAARALATAGFLDEADRLRVDARFVAAEAALAAGDREKAAEEADKAMAARLPAEGLRETRVRAARVFVRAGKREAAIGALGWAVSRGFADADLLEKDPAFEPIRADSAFRQVVKKAREKALSK